MKAAFILSARTPNNDYVMDKFLVAPDDFDDEENRKVHAYFARQTQYLQTDPSGCIRVTYCDEAFIVLGVGTYISTLYDNCGREAQYSLDVKERQAGKLPRRYPAFLGFAFIRNDIHKAFDVTFELLAKCYERYISGYWNKPLIYGGMKPVSSRYEELTFSKADDSSKVAVSFSPKMLKYTIASPIPAEPEEQDEPDEPEHTVKESKQGFNVLFASAVIGLSVAAALLGMKLSKNAEPNNRPENEHPTQQVIIPQSSDQVSTDHH